MIQGFGFFGYGFRDTGSGFMVKVRGLRFYEFQGYGLQVTGYELQVYDLGYRV
jgi:hypothetical protein